MRQVIPRQIGRRYPRPHHRHPSPLSQHLIGVTDGLLFFFDQRHVRLDTKRNGKTVGNVQSRLHHQAEVYGLCAEDLLVGSIQHG